MVSHNRCEHRSVDRARFAEERCSPDALNGGHGRAIWPRPAPTVVLVRDIPDAVLSYFFKWREAKALGPLDGALA